jgi:hypothetical protein
VSRLSAKCWSLGVNLSDNLDTSFSFMLHYSRSSANRHTGCLQRNAPTWSYRVSTTKRSDSGDVLKISNGLLHV